jgi:oxygen-independent coproporphyrinogen-3 oxidase
LGIQSFNSNDLKLLGRDHTGTEALYALKHAKSIFEKVTFDLIYARPGQTLDAWKNELKVRKQIG